MNKFILCALLAMGMVAYGQPGKKANDSIDIKVEALLKKMSLKEKIGQMAQIDIATFINRVDPHGTFYGPQAEPHTLSADSLQKYVNDYGIGSVFNIGSHGYTPQQWYELIKLIQDYAAKTPNKIPVLYCIDAIHGNALTVGATLFPQELGMASTWNPGLVEKAGEVTAYEMRASNVPFDFGPSLDLGRHPVWSRINESFGEDVYLVSKLARSAVDGQEGIDNNIGDKTKITTNIKHYVGYGFPLTGKDRTQSWIPEHFVREYFLPPFDSCIKAGAHTLLLSSGEINGEPLHGSKFWVDSILRKELGFKGAIFTDWRDVEKLYYFHHVASSYKEAIVMAIDAGIDVNMVPYDNQFMDLLAELVKEGSIKESRIDESVRRILRLKFELGLFEHPYRNPSEYPDFGSEKFTRIALQSANESMILLKNNNSILPLSKKAKVLVTGPAANAMQALNGGWTYSWQGVAADAYASEKNTILEAIQQKIGNAQVKYIPGSGFNESADINAAVNAAKDVDYIIVCLGETPYAETPGFIEDLYIPDAQADLAKAMAATGKPVILLLSEGRPRLISKFENKMQAVIVGFLSGNEGGNTFANVLFGDYNPCGKLPLTYPRYPNDLITYDHKEGDKADHYYGFTMGYNPQYPFGFGLSYTTYNYSNLVLSSNIIGFDDQLTVSVDVTNSGKIDGQEIVQLYVSDLIAKITPPTKRLRGFEKVSLKAGETKTVRFKISVNDLKYVGMNNKWTTEPGDFSVSIANLTKNFVLK